MRPIAFQGGRSNGFPRCRLKNGKPGMMSPLAAGGGENSLMP